MLPHLRLRARAALAVLAALAVSVSARAEEAPDDARLAQSLDRDLAVRVAIARNPALKASAQRALGIRAMAVSEGRLPPPELSFNLWAVPFVRPVSFGDGSMISLGLSQTFPAPGSLSAHEEATDKSADAEIAMSLDGARDVVRAVDHALVDLEEAGTMEDSHISHRNLAGELEQIAIARQAGGGTLSDVVQARIEVASFEAEVASEAAAAMKARILLNALLARPADAPLARPALPPPATVAAPIADLMLLAKKDRPELRAAEARDQAQQASLRAAEREATWPMFSLGIMYTAPTTLMPEHGYGLTASMSLPWLWGAASHKADAQEKLALATSLDKTDAQYRIGVDVASAFGSVKASEARLLVLAGRSLPAAKQALDVALASYRSGQGDVLSLLRAERAVVDSEVQIIMARVALEHALVDLDWAVGTRVARAPVLGLVGATP